MLEWAGGVITQAQKHGLITIVWAYPRGQAVPNERDPKIIAGAAGVATALGADFVKVNIPDSPYPFEDLKEAIDAAGNTGLIAAGGGNKPEQEFLKDVYRINRAGAGGNAVGRNIHQRSLEDAKRLCAAMSKIIYDNATLEDALKLLEKKYDEPAQTQESNNW
jgi:fructose-bisphosphate aldolase/6-deoxy-5-ketofructose 1-phosphate synthase